MVLIRIALIAYLAGLAAYTAVVIANHGWNLVPIFLGDMAAMTWPGQFNLDFTGFLALSAAWTAWRHRFSPAGLGLAVVAFFGGMLFLSIYLLIASFKAKTVQELMLGPARSAS